MSDYKDVSIDTKRAYENTTSDNRNVKFHFHVETVMWPKSGYRDGDYAIMKVKIDKIVYGDPVDFKHCNIVHLKASNVVTLSGNMPSVNRKTEYVTTATLETSKYGFCYKSSIANEYYDFSNKEAQKAFLSAIISTKTIDSLYAKFDNPFELLENRDTESLCQVNGIGAVVANKLINKYEKSIDKGQAYAELIGQYGLTRNMVDKLINHYKSATILINKIKENPYILIKEASGIGWKKADAMAQAAGLTENDPRRIEAYVVYTMDDKANNEGHTWMYVKDVVDIVCSVITLATRDSVLNAINKLIDDEYLYCEKCEENNGDKIGIMYYRHLEEDISKELYRIDKCKSSFDFSDEYINDVIKSCEGEEGFSYTDEQREIIWNVLTGDHNVSIITGLAGCGKSSVMKPIVEAMRRKDLLISQCALSGKAALNLTEITGIEGKTIHRLLGFTAKTSTMSFFHGKGSPLLDDVIILDELSMVGGEIFLCLLNAIRDGAKLVCIGDVGQLESIGICNCLNDMVNSGVMKHYHLTKIMRQAEKSAIITESIKIYNQVDILPHGFYGRTIRGENMDFEIQSAESTEEAADLAIKEYLQTLKEQCNNDLENIILLCSKRLIGAASALSVNKRLHNILTNMNDTNTIEVGYDDDGAGHGYFITYRTGDRIKVTKNCYDTIDENGTPTPVFNGNIGTIIWIEDGEMCVKFLHGNVILTSKEIYNITLGYAITTHSAQGSGFPYVVCICDPSAYTLNTKELLYTQITRAKKHCTLIGRPAIISSSIKKTNVKTKQTWLTGLLQRDFAF